MSKRFFIAFICLLAFLAELTINTSTPFVRAFPDPAQGTLFVSSCDWSSSCHGIPGDQSTPAGSHRDLSKLRISAHSGSVSVPVILNVIVPVARLTLVSEPPLSEPSPSSPQRPPSA